jgi:siroheme synthase
VPIAAIQHASLLGQWIVSSNVATRARKSNDERSESPAILVIGAVGAVVRSAQAAARVVHERGFLAA